MNGLADSWVWRGLYEAAAMVWEVLWALVLGFFVSGMLQVFVSKERMQQEFGRANLRTVGLAVLFGAASSSCSFAAAAAGKTTFKKGAAFVPMVAFMFSATNLVVELGAIMWLLLGWRFVLAEFVGAFVLVGSMWAIVSVVKPDRFLKEGRERAESDSAGHDHAMAESGLGWRQKVVDSQTWALVGQAFVMDWKMVLRDIAIGFLIAGYIAALVPNSFWNRLFLTGHPGPGQMLENALVGPLVAVISFVCSIGNIPLASVLWSGGISFGGVVEFIFADLITLPLLFIYVRYYGRRMAAYLTLVLFASMVISGIVVDQLFTLAGISPTGPRPASPAMQARFAWNYTTWLDLAALAGAAGLVALSRRSTHDMSHGCCGH